MESRQSVFVDRVSAGRQALRPKARVCRYCSSLVIGCVLCAALFMSGCAKGTPTSVSVPPTPAQSPLIPMVVPVSEATPTPELQPLIVTLSLWLPRELDPYSDELGADVLARQLEDFSVAYPDVQVEVVVKDAHGRGGLLDFLRTARDAAPSVMPDLVVLDADELETAFEWGLIQPLDALLPSGETLERFPFAVEWGAVNEPERGGPATMGFLIGADMQHLAYRPALLESPPVSWTYFISPPVTFLFAAGGRDRQVNDATLIQYLAAGGKLTDEEGDPWLDEGVLIGVLDFYDDCVNAPTFSPTIITPTMSLTAALEISSAAPLTVPIVVSPTVILPPVSMIVSPTAVLGIGDADRAWELFKGGEGDIAIVPAGRYWLEADETYAPAPIPTRDGQPFSIARRGWAIAIATGDPARQSLAMLLFNWFIAPDRNGQWTQAAGYLPGTRSALRQWDISSADRAALRGVMDATVPAPPAEVMDVVGPVMQEALKAVLQGRATPEEAAASAVESLRQ
jgi:ABC-type glycerol-3-phosphate transport system substrate-binding protein